MNFKLYTLFLLPLLLLLNSCCKEGTDGKATVIATVRHHTYPIKGGTLYIKFNSKELPGTNPTDFDTYFTGSNADNIIRCESLKCGDYYLYVTGYDSSLMQVVSGGVPLKIKYSQRKNEISLDVPVSEKH